MEQQQLDAFKNKLIQQQTELYACESASKESSDTVELDQARVGRLSRMDALQAQQMALETERRRQLQLKKIEGALRRIASDDFGYCFKCGSPIDQRRLQADPTHTRCIGCLEP